MGKSQVHPEVRDEQDGEGERTPGEAAREEGQRRDKPAGSSRTLFHSWPLESLAALTRHLSALQRCAGALCSSWPCSPSTPAGQQMTDRERVSRGGLLTKALCTGRVARATESVLPHF